ncbi:hypothetical protein F4810DRAFT_649530 [Camillea tinctor]|nr:hypothetical protein F4810DRAFT_649530 [Camillea tinctor]
MPSHLHGTTHLHISFFSFLLFFFLSLPILNPHLLHHDDLHNLSTYCIRRFTLYAHVRTPSWLVFEGKRAKQTKTYK